MKFAGEGLRFKELMQMLGAELNLSDTTVYHLLTYKLAMQEILLKLIAKNLKQYRREICRGRCVDFRNRLKIISIVWKVRSENQPQSME